MRQLGPGRHWKSPKWNGSKGAESHDGAGYAVEWQHRRGRARRDEACRDFGVVRQQRQSVDSMGAPRQGSAAVAQRGQTTAWVDMFGIGSSGSGRLTSQWQAAVGIGSNGAQGNELACIGKAAQARIGMAYFGTQCRG